VKNSEATQEADNRNPGQATCMKDLKKRQRLQLGVKASGFRLKTLA